MSISKRLLAAAFATALSVGAAAAPAAAPKPTAATNAEVDRQLAEVRDAVYARKDVALKKVMQLGLAQQDAFDPVLKAYDAELKLLGDRHAALIKEFAGYYDAKSLDDANAKRLVDATFAVKREKLDLLNRYFATVSKAIGVRKAAEWVQLEYAFMASVDSKIANAMPVLSDAMKE
jgi:hypothetical protein